jgi:hypothetical protein
MSEHDLRDDYDDGTWSVEVAPDSTLARAASALWWLGLTQFVMAQLVLVAVVLLLVGIGPAINDRGAVGPEFAVPVAAWLGGSALNAFVVWAAYSARRCRHYLLVVVAAIFAVMSLPGVWLSPVTTPIAIWVLIAVARRDVRTRFSTVARGKIISPSPEPFDARRTDDAA